MKVCILTVVHQPFDVRIFHKEAKSLINAGYDVVLIAQHDKEEIASGLKIIPLQKPKNRIQRMTFTTWQLFRKALRQNADIYHFHDPELMSVGVLLKLLGKKVIYDVHEDVPKQIMSKYYIPHGLRKIISVSIGVIENFASLLFDAIITATEDIHRNFKRPNVVCVKNYPLLELFNQKGADGGEFFKAIYVGGLTPERGITQMVQAMEHLDGVVLTLIGNFSPPDYENEVRRLKGFEKTVYYRPMAYKLIPEYLSKANVGIVCFQPEPNHINSQPNKLFEYMACGLPVIASNFPLWQQIVEGNRCGLTVNPSKPEEIAKAIEYLINHPDEAKQMGENGRKAVEERYNWGLEGKRLVGLYKELEM